MSTPERELAPAEALRAEREAERDVHMGADIDVEGDPVAAIAAEPEGPEVSIAFSPRQILGGFALLAALLVLLFRRRRDKSKDG